MSARAKHNLLTPERLALAQALLEEAGIETQPRSGLNQPPLIVSADRNADLPLSFGQQRLWFLHQWEPNSALYNTAAKIRFQGPLNVGALELSLNEIVRRHESLRTTFRSVEGRPLQVIAPDLTIPLRLVDLSPLTDAERQSEVQRWSAAEARCPFDLSQGPLLRATLLRLDAQEHVLILVVHHIVSDGWSVAIFAREFGVLYSEFAAEQSGSPLPDLALQYADYAAWQRAWLHGEVLEKQLAYWQQQLADSPPALELPADRPRPAHPSFRGALHTFQLAPQLTHALHSLGRQAGATLFMTLLAAFKVLLYRYTGQTDLVVGTPIANRNRVEWEGLIGFFVNALALRTQLSGDMSFREVLRRVQEVALGAYAHQDLPFEALVEALQVERSLSHAPLFQVVFALQNTPKAVLAHDDLVISLAEIDTETAKFDLVLYIEEFEQGLKGTFEYSTDLFEAATIARLEEHYRTLLNSLIADPDRRIADLAILPQAERQQVLVEWNATRADYPRDRYVHELFEAQAARTPDAAAVVSEDQHLTYQELNRRANQLAHYLRRKGVAAGSVVAVMDDRTPETIVSYLGVLKAGGAYLPIDTHEPIDRVLFILNDSQVSFLLTRERIVMEVPFAKRRNLQDIGASLVVTPARAQIKDLDTLPFPDRNLVDYGKYDRHYSSNGYVKRGISLMTSRGCPYKCLYCHKIWPKTHVTRSAENIFREILLCYARGYRTFSVWDDIFNLDRQTSEAFFRLVIQHHLGIRLLFPNGLRGDILTPDYIDLMAEAGVVQLGIALETASPRLQRLIHKNLKIDRLRDNLAYLCGKYPHIIVDLLTMFGFPTETEAEALLTLDFVKSIQWLHFPVVSALKIFPNTDMARFAVEQGVSPEAIEKSTALAYHQPSETLPFAQSFAREYQSKYLTEYFLLPERLSRVIPAQKKVLTRDELVSRYNNYLPGGLENYPDVVRLLDGDGFYSEQATPAAAALSSSLVGVDKKITHTPPGANGGLRILLIDLSQHFSHATAPLFNPVEAPLGLMYLATYVKREFGDKVDARIAKSRIDFDSFEALQALIEDLDPQVIGIRTLSLYKDFFHAAAAQIKGWRPDIPIVTGGPYATSEYATILADWNVDLVVVGEGELTFAELIGKIIDNDSKLPDADVLGQIAGLAFVPRRCLSTQNGKRVGRRVLLLDRIADEIAREETSNPQRPNHANDLAYVIYTSGTTGHPKGVQIEHESLLNLVFWHQRAFGVSALDRATQLAGLAFDASVWELWPYLTAGAGVCLPDEETRLLPDRLRDWLVEMGITITFLPTPLAEATLLLDWPKRLALRTMLTGGERLDRYPKPGLPFELVNNYGPTENTVVATSGRVFPKEQADGLPSIGRPIANVQTYILDEHLQPVPIGVAGELYIGGDSLARGYLNRPELTAERFIPNPFVRDEGGGRNASRESEKFSSSRILHTCTCNQRKRRCKCPSSLLYKTGDLARYLPDGHIEFLGRIDHQVKIRGFRIELGEIEAALGQHPAVRETVVIAQARENEAGGKRLIAYVVPDSCQSLTLGELRDHLQERLPEYMLPSVFVLLDALPLTPNGKVDRRALPAPEGERSELAGAYVAPCTVVEQQLASVWAQVLGVERVSVGDNFFVLGGHSLLATQIVSRVRTAFQVELRLQTLFEAPTIAEMARCIEAAQQATPAVAAPPLRPSARQGNLPLSFAQHRLWFLDQLEPDNPFYNIPAALHLKGCLDLAALEQSLNEIVRRHEALRTTFDSVEGQPRQIIAPIFKVPLPVTDLRELPPLEREAQARWLADEEAQRPFDLTRGPLVRASVLHLAADEHVLLLNMHHIVSDGWSMGIFTRELAALYQSFVERQPVCLPELPLQYADYAVWQRQWLQGEVLEQQLAYWKRQLADAPAVLDLPTDHPRPAMQTFRGRQQAFTLPHEVFQALQALAQRQQVTLFMLLLGAFKTLLYRYTRQADIVVGTPIANRNRSEIEGLIGFFVNTLTLHTDLSGNPSFREVLGRVREVALGAYAHQDVPFEMVVEALQPERDLSHTPLFQVMFIVQNAPLEIQALPGLTTQLLEMDSATAKFDLSLSLFETEHGWTGSLTYSTELFEAPTIARLLSHYQTLLESIVADPGQRIADLAILSAAERRQVLSEWNDTQIDYPHTRCIHELFEAQAARTPEAEAVVFEEQRLTYRELNQRANQLAHHLSGLGVGPEALVGLCVERSIEMVIGLLGILKAGGAYVPLDPTYPAERLACMLEDARVSWLLTQAHLVDRLPAHSAHTICLDADWPTIAQSAIRNPQSAISGDNLAYVIYTSGSTGQPKGIMIQHRSVVNLATGLDRAIYAQQPGSLRVSLNGSISFDTSVKQLIQLLKGHTLYIVPEAIRFDAPALAALIQSQALDVLDCTPSQLRLLVEEGLLEQAAGAPLQVLVGGEAIDESLWARLAQAGTLNFYNVYGPTECTVDAALCRVRQAPDKPTLGRPIANTQIYIVDERLQPVPIGAPGELCIAGAGLARGYLNRPELTAERFIPNPFVRDEGGTPSSLLYKTGDLARYLPDGRIEFLGRVDHQVKIRGYRIELGEIEAALNQHPAVREAVVLVQEDQPGDQRLIAYLCLELETTPSVADLRRSLQGRLPEYMLPAAFVLLDTLPRTPNGKLDRRALLALNTARAPLAQACVTPRSPTEELLVDLWRAVLGSEQIGIHDNFFELGGHSLLATQVLSRIRHAFQVELRLHALFEAPTIAGLAGRIEAAQREMPAFTAPPLQPIARQGDLALSFAQQRLWFLDQLAPGNAGYNIPFAVRFVGGLDVTALERAFNEIVRRHETLRTTFAVSAGRPIQIIAPTWTIALPVVDLQELTESERETRVQQLTREEALRPFDLVYGPLLRATLLRLSAHEQVLLLTMHHIVSDGWSMGVFVREMAALYQAFCAEQPTPLPELPIQYADYAAWQREWLSGEVLETQLGYWKRQLSGELPALELPTDRPRPPVQSFRGDTHTFSVAPAMMEALKALSRREGVTLFMTLLAAFQTLLQRYTGQSDVIVGAPIANRNRVETEGLIGFFVNTLALRVDLSGNLTFDELLGRVREATLGAYAHQDLPFDRLVEELHLDRDLSRTPLFQVMFALQNAPQPSVELPGLQVVPLETNSETAKFDLTLSMTETVEGLQAVLEYNTDLFDAATIARLGEHLQTLLAGIVAHPDWRLSELPLLAETERRQLLVAWNDTRANYPRDLCIHKLVEAQAEQTPSAVAVVCGEEQLTYQELNRRANQLAHYLQRSGIGPEMIVGVCMERSAEMIVALLGILKAGAAYLPLDPGYPAERLHFELEDARAAALLTQQRLAERLPGEGVRLVCLDADWPAIGQSPTTNSQSPVTSDNLAYVIYTSGSTGTPKGVQIEHRGLLNLVFWHQRAFAVTASDRATQLAGVAFDASVWEVWPYLAAGASLHIPDEATRSLPSSLRDWLVSQGITISFLPTPLAEAALALEWPPTCGLRVLLTGGDRLHDYPPSALPFELVNNYGPTENSVVTTSGIVAPQARAEGAPPIGRPIDNTQVYILDGNLQSAPVGVAGELYIGGDSLARGYLNRPELTAERFIPNPLTPPIPPPLSTGGDRGGSARLYKTGDLARYLPDGNIEFLGRIDHQVKIRGFRIELGEIEAALRQHPVVRETVVIVREDQPGDKRLVAYVVPQAAAPDAGELRRLLQDKLPEYMLPSAFVALEALPLTPNGKVDRRALPAPEQTRSELADSFAAPRDVLELHLVHLWEELLGVQPIGIRHNFFELGGHSLLAIQLLARVQQEWGYQIPVAALFQAATVEHLAVVLRQRDESAPASALVRMQAGDARQRPVFLVHPGGGHVLCYANLVRHLGVSQPCYGLQARGLDSAQAPDTRIETMAQHYVELLRAAQPDGPYLLGGWSLGGVIAFEMAQQLQAQGQPVALLALLDAAIPESNPEPEIDELELLANLALNMGLALDAFTFERQRFEALTPDERLTILLEHLKRAKIVPLDMELPQVRRLFQVFRCNTLALRRYTPRMYTGSIALFQAGDQLSGEPVSAKESGWRALAGGGLTVHTLPGNHYTLLREPNITLLAEQLQAHLRAVEANQSSSSEHGHGQ